jgi:hypothetical protein
MILRYSQEEMSGHEYIGLSEIKVHLWVSAVKNVKIWVSHVELQLFVYVLSRDDHVRSI